jgi:tetratricopeptide (TPR) repeat protein
MSRWLAAIVVLAGVLAVGGVAFLNGGDPLPIRVTPSRTIALSLGMALALSFALGAAFVALLALAGATVRAGRRWRAARSAARHDAAVTRERMRAETLLAGGDADAARTRLANAVTVHGEDEHLLELLAGASEQSGDVGGAIAAVEAARARLPASPLLTRRLRALYAAAGRWEDALALEAELVRSLGPAAAAAEATTLCGLRLEAACADAEPARAVRRLLGLAREHPGFTAAWVVAGDRLRDAGRTVRARRVYERGVRARPATVLLERLSALDAAAGQPDRTLRTLRRAIRLHPRDPAPLATLARRHLRDEAVDAAEAVLARWPADGPPVPALEALRGECCRRRGFLDEALVHLGRAADVLHDPGAMRCRGCGAVQGTWAPRCTSCGRWDTIAGDADAHDGDSSVDLMPSPRRSTVPNHCVTETPG